MAQREIHYEVYRRRATDRTWSLHDVALVRETALELARELLAGHRAAGVKVTKESYDPDTGDFLSLKIYEEVHPQQKSGAVFEEAPHALPCRGIDDLYASPARVVMARVLSEFLAQHTLTITELLHRADMVERLESTGTVYQHAMQKIAVAQAASAKLPVQQIMRGLDRLATEAAHRLYRDARSGYLPAATVATFPALAVSLAGEADAPYRLKAAIASLLAPANGWSEKLGLLLCLLAAAPEQARDQVFHHVDEIVAELLAVPGALGDLLGPTENFGETLSVLTGLFLCELDGSSAHAPELLVLERRFAADDLPLSRASLAARITAELRSMRRLCPSVERELELVRRLANRLVLGQGKYLSHADIADAFVLRSRRFVSQEYVNEYLAPAASPEEKLERLLALEDSIVGAENWKRLAEFAHALVGSPQFESHFQAAHEPVLQRLRRIAELQARIRRARLDESDRAELATALDRIASNIEARAKVLESLAQKFPDPAQRLNAIVKLWLSGALTEGRLSEKARVLILRALATPGFFQGYMKTLGDQGRAPDARDAMAALLQSLEKVGIPQDRGLSLIAA